MAKYFQPQIVSANDLLLGSVVYLDGLGTWTPLLRNAAVAQDEETAYSLIAKASPQQDKVVGPYLLNVTLDDDGLPFPSHFREKFRDRGPSNRPDLGRQATYPLRLNPLSASGGI